MTEFTAVDSSTLWPLELSCENLVFYSLVSLFGAKLMFQMSKSGIERFS